MMKLRHSKAEGRKATGPVTARAVPEGTMTGGLRAIAAGLVALACLLAPASTLAQATLGGEWREDVDEFVQQVVDAGLAPGLAVAVSMGEWELYSRGCGTADLDTGRPVGPATSFYIASSSKALTATSVVLRAARGELDLEAPVTRYLPGLRLSPPLEADAVTLEALLTMTDGIDQAGPVVFRTAYTGVFTPQTLLRLLADYGPGGDGGGFAYRNLPYNILGLVLDPGGDGHGWKRVVEEEVLEPLAMGSTSAVLSRLDPERVAQPHVLVPGKGWRRTRLAKDDANLHAAGGHFASAADLIRFVAAHASHGRLEGERIFPAAPIAAAHQPRVDQDRDFGPYERWAWGYGWDLAEWHGRTLVQRFGAFSGYRSHMSFEPASGLGVVVLTNGGGIASDAADLVAGFVYDRLVKAGEPFDGAGALEDLRREAEEFQAGMGRHLAERADRLAPLRHPLEHFAGSYANPKLGTCHWMVVAEGLEMRCGIVASRAEIFDADRDLLRVEIGSGVVTGFEFSDDGGPARAMILRGERFERVIED